MLHYIHFNEFVLVHAGYLFVSDTLNTMQLLRNHLQWNARIFFNSSQINACVVEIGVLGPPFIVSSEGLGLHKMLPSR